MKKFTIGILCATLMTSGSITSMSALEVSSMDNIEPYWETCVNPSEGGEWCYGKNFFAYDEDYSNYLHHTRAHSTSVESNDGNVSRSAIVDSGKWAKSSVRDDGPNFKVYYNVH